MKLTDLSKLETLLSADDKQQLAQAEAVRAAKRKIGDGHTVRVLLDKKARRGKAVTMVTELALSSEMRDKLAKELRQRLSVGGTVYDDVIELQGEHVERAAAYLREQGFVVKTK